MDDDTDRELDAADHELIAAAWRWHKAHNPRPPDDGRDIVVRLRHASNGGAYSFHWIVEAADEIERLRAELRCPSCEGSGGGIVGEDEVKCNACGGSGKRGTEPPEPDFEPPDPRDPRW